MIQFRLQPGRIFVTVVVVVAVLGQDAGGLEVVEEELGPEPGGGDGVRWGVARVAVVVVREYSLGTVVWGGGRGGRGVVGVVEGAEGGGARLGGAWGVDGHFSVVVFVKREMWMDKSLDHRN